MGQANFGNHACSSPRNRIDYLWSKEGVILRTSPLSSSAQRRPIWDREESLHSRQVVTGGLFVASLPACWGPLRCVSQTRTVPDRATCDVGPAAPAMVVAAGRGVVSRGTR